MALPFDKARAEAQGQQTWEFPYVSWRTGKTDFTEGSFQYTGGFFLNEESVPADARIPGWKPVEITVKDKRTKARTKKAGLGASVAFLAPVRYREKWETDPESGKGRSKLHLVAFVRGYAEPLCFVFSGPMTRDIRGMLMEHRRVAAFANRSKPKGAVGLPAYCFWLKLEAGKHFMAGSGSAQTEVTYPEYRAPEKLTDESVEKMFIGAELMDEAQDLFVSLAPWQAEWPRQERQTSVDVAQSGYPELNTAPDPQARVEKARAAAALGHTDRFFEEPPDDDYNGEW